MKDNLKRFVLIDGHALIHRAYHAYPQSLTTTKGELVNAVYGFTSILFSIFKELHPEYVAVTFDLKGPTFRHKEFADYKVSRPKVDEELIDQIGRVKEVVKALNIPIFEVTGFEADDVIGTLVQQAGKLPKKLEVVIATGDRDALQLVGKDVKIYFPGRGKVPAHLVGETEFREKYGFSPQQMIDFKALAGDASDDIPGVSGIGPKTATDLIQKFGNLDGIYQALGVDLHKAAMPKTKSQLPPLKTSSQIKESVAKKLLTGIESALLSRKLATIVMNVPLKLDLKRCKLSDYDKDKVIKLFSELEFRTLMNRLPGKEGREAENKNQKLGEKKALKEKQMELF